MRLHKLFINPCHLIAIIYQLNICQTLSFSPLKSSIAVTVKGSIYLYLLYMIVTQEMYLIQNPENLIIQ